MVELKISPEKIRLILNDIWPSLEYIWCFDHSYIQPTYEQVLEFIKNNPLNINEITQENPDCDDFALIFHASVKKKHNWSLGEVFGDKFNGWSGNHLGNIVFCDNVVYLIDPKIGSIWKANSEQDRIYYVRM